MSHLRRHNVRMTRSWFRYFWFFYFTRLGRGAGGTL